jgi:hypothetical protein
MIHLIGYSALFVNLISMTMKNILHLRLLSLLGNAIYVFYGILLSSPPLIVGGTIAVGIQSFQIYKLKNGKQ